ncbi:MAG: HDOD domain-containing protein [Gammaproteobacteria bacterium]|nr:HDOD domain-containing protein [Gammaproteobacteria bacterium]
MSATEKPKIGRYEIVESIGRGAQGAVYLGRDPVLDRLVAIKVLTERDAELQNKADDGAPLEARISGRLKHPNIVPIFDAGECKVGPYLVFEYVKGQTLAEILKTRGALSIEDAAPLIAAILKGMAAAHAADILHLDLSPRNVLIDADGMPRVMDFGLAQYVSTARETKDYATGTLRYMAPEHFRGEALGQWTDVFALGSTFFEVVSNQKAMAGGTMEGIQARIMTADVDYSAIAGQPHGDEFVRFLAGALEPSREGRYADCSVMSEAFDLFLESAGLAAGLDRGSSHSTVDFLLRRMQRTGDFPTISRTLSDINRLTGDDGVANADKLANVILRDFALTQKLLKLVNSAFYGARASEITSISQAVVFLGVEQVRMTANSLSFFGHMKGDSAQLKDSMTRSFLSGLIARHLARRARLKAAEEAFICGMCQNLGENLVMFYFADEYRDIRELRSAKDLGKAAAARGVLGVSYADLGAAVAREWNLPKSIIESVRGVPPGPLAKPASEDEQLRDFAVFANDLCELFQKCCLDELDDALTGLLERFAPSIAVEPDYTRKLVAAGFEKLKQYAPIFEINVAKSGYCSAVQAWVDLHSGTMEESQAVNQG